MKPNDEQVNFVFGVAEAIKKLRPGCEFEIMDRTITKWWDPNELPPPSWDEIEIVYNEDRVKYEKLQYARDRQAEYPSIETQLDMIWHCLNDGEDLKLCEWVSLIKQIKQKYPKPE